VDDQVASYRKIRPDYGPPENELPVVVPAPDLVWRGDGIVFAIPSLQVYTTGAELLILCRSTRAQIRDVEHSRSTARALDGLRADGHHVGLLGGEHKDHGFTYRAWTTFSEDIPDVDGVVTFTLDWPGTDPAEHRVAGLREAASRVVVLW
jgi:hypothetical protein